MVSFVLLGAIGGGVGLLVSRADGAAELGDVVAAAPAYGIALCVLVATGVAVAGGDPGGGGSLAIVCGAALACWLAQLGRAARSSSTRSTSPAE